MFCIRVITNSGKLTIPSLPKNTQIKAKIHTLRQERIGIVGTPHWQGQPLDGTHLAPQVLRHYADLQNTLTELSYNVKDYGDVAVPYYSTDSPFQQQGRFAAVQRPRTVGETNRRLSAAVQEILRDNRTVLHLGGDHSLALGSVHGHANYMSSLYRHPTDGASLSVLWVDAHADIHTTYTTETGNLHGCPISFLLNELASPHTSQIPGHAWIKPAISARRLAYIGLRNVDKGEREIIKRLGIAMYCMSDVDHYGVEKCFEMAMDKINTDGKLPLHVSFDIDSLDMLEVPSTGTPEPGGLSLREGWQLLQQIRNTKLMTAFDLVEVNPIMGSAKAQRKTLSAASQMIGAVFGAERIGPWRLSRDAPTYFDDMDQEDLLRE